MPKDYPQGRTLGTVEVKSSGGYLLINVEVYYGPRCKYRVDRGVKTVLYSDALVYALQGEVTCTNNQHPF